MSKDRGRILTEYRQSNAAGIHSSVQSRRDEELEALAFELEANGLRRNVMSVTYVDFGGPNPDLDELDEPTDEDLQAIEEDDWDLMDELDRYFEPDLYGPDNGDDDRFPFDDYEEDYDYDDEY